MSENAGRTRVTIDGTDFLIDGERTYRSQSFRGTSIEGLLFNVRAVQATFDDDNAETVDRWAYPDTGEWDPDRNVREFCEVLPAWYDHGVRAVTLNLQGGRPVLSTHEGGTDPAARDQPWTVSAFRADGTLKPAWLDRLERVLDRADELGMVVILGLFYQGQDGVLDDEAAVETGVRNAVDWLFDRGYRHVLVEIDNECDADYDHDVLGPERVPRLIDLASSVTRDGHRYPVGTSFTGGSVPTDAVVDASDYVLLHGNVVDDPDRVAEMVDETRALPAYDSMPVVFNEDDVAMCHGPADGYGFGPEHTHLSAAVDRFASWGYYEKGDNDYRDGYQCPPVNWEHETERARAFFDALADVASTS